MRKRMVSFDELAERAAEIDDLDALHTQDLVAMNLEAEPPSRYGFPLELDRVIRDDSPIWKTPLEREREQEAAR